MSSSTCSSHACTSTKTCCITWNNKFNTHEEHVGSSLMVGVFPAGVRVTCTLLSVCYVMPRCSVNVTTTQVGRTVSAALEGSNLAAGDQDLTCPCPKALPTPVRT